MQILRVTTRSLPIRNVKRVGRGSGLLSDRTTPQHPQNNFALSSSCIDCVAEERSKAVMASEKRPSITLSSSSQTGRGASPQGLRLRPLGRASTFAEDNSRLGRRSSSFISETLSETRRSLRSSTDDILLPRLKDGDDVVDHDENSHWQSLPLGLALLPAVGGLVFKNGSAVITDVTLLGLAAIFMNWALRSPW